MMTTILDNLKQLQLTCGMPEPNNNINCGSVFAERTGEYINQYNLFVTKFNIIPDIIIETKINCKKANEWFMERYQSEIKEYHYNVYGNRNNKYPQNGELYYYIDEDFLVNIHITNDTVRLLFKKSNLEKVEEIRNGIKKFRLKKENSLSRIYLLINSKSGLEIKGLDINKPKLNIEDNYNDDFIEIHKTIIKRLTKKNDKGLVLLHGKPGTGKTSYIRYLASLVKKDVIFLPPNMASAMTNPNLIPTLIENSESIFVIEDAENIIMDRDKNGQSPVSALLNITDGLLSDCLNIQVICSFNTDSSKVDNALMRKGRLIAKYEFKELELNKAQALSDKLSFKTIINKPMTLTDIYNQEEKGFQQQNERGTIGFRRDIA